MANQLSVSGGDVRLLVLIDTVPARGGKLRGLRRVARKFSRHLSLMSDVDPVHWAGYLLGVLRKEVKQLGARRAHRQRVNQPRTLGDFLYAQHEKYAPPSYHGPMKVLRCMRNGSHWNEENLGWATYAKGPIEIGEMPDDHTAVMGEPIVALVAAYLDKWLAEANSTVSSASGIRA